MLLSCFDQIALEVISHEARAVIPILAVAVKHSYHHRARSTIKVWNDLEGVLVLLLKIVRIKPPLAQICVPQRDWALTIIAYCISKRMLVPLLPRTDLREAEWRVRERAELALALARQPCDTLLDALHGPPPARPLVEKGKAGTKGNCDGSAGRDTDAQPPARAAPILAKSSCHRTRSSCARWIHSFRKEFQMDLRDHQARSLHDTQEKAKQNHRGTTPCAPPEATATARC